MEHSSSSASMSPRTTSMSTSALLVSPFASPTTSAGVATLLARLRALHAHLSSSEATGGYEVAVTAAWPAPGCRGGRQSPADPRLRPGHRPAGQDRPARRAGHRALCRSRPPEPRPVPDEQAQAWANSSPVGASSSTCSPPSRTGAACCVIGPAAPLDAHIAWLEEALRRLDHDLTTLVRSTPIWREADDLLRSVPGIGPVTACTLIADLPELGPPRSSPHRRPRRRGAFRPRQRHLPRPPHDRRRAAARPPRAVHGHARRHQTQSRDSGVPPASRDRRPARQGRHHRRHAQAAHHPQRDAA